MNKLAKRPKIDEIEIHKEAINISAPQFRRSEFIIYGTAPYMQARFSEKARETMMSTMRAGSLSSSRRKKEPRDFERDFQQAQHISEEGWVGIPASSIRAAMISACRLVKYKMTFAKLSVFVEADGFDKVDGIPLVKLISGPPEMSLMHARNATGVTDIRARPMWREWSARLLIKVDADQFSFDDVANLLERAGQQVGIGEGRPDSRESYGLGLGTFTLTPEQ